MKIIATLLILLSLLTLVSCVDVDLSDSDRVYEELVAIINNSDEYVGKTVKLTATYTAVYNFSKNELQRHNLVATSPAGSGRAAYRIVKEDGVYPLYGETVTAIGTFREGGFIEVDRFEDTALDSASYEIDTLEMSAKELNDFVTAYCAEYHESESFEKSIRIFGHCVAYEDYFYLMGLDANGSMTWVIELYDPDGIIPFKETESSVVNPVEVIGELTIYMEDNLAYACIKVDRILSVDSTFS